MGKYLKIGKKGLILGKDGNNLPGDDIVKFFYLVLTKPKNIFSITPFNI